MLSKPKNRKVAAILAFVSIVIPISGLHKFYVGQPLWGSLYILLSLATPIPKIASAIEGVWYLTQGNDEFDQNFNGAINPQSRVQTPLETVDPAKIGAIAEAVRQLDQLRQDGLISEYEFEQKRRQLLDHIA
jgi:TM2 domain-containing membrane protein YozV